jgi:hypothetical protein
MDVEPITGNRYLNRDNGELFQVVGLDGDAGTIEIQLDNGNLDEIPGVEWGRMDIELVAPELNVQAPTNDISDGPIDAMDDDPEALNLPSSQEQYRRRNVEFAGKAARGFPNPRPENEVDRGPERGSELGIEQWQDPQEGEEDRQDEEGQ